MRYFVCSTALPWEQALYSGLTWLAMTKEEKKIAAKTGPHPRLVLP